MKKINLKDMIGEKIGKITVLKIINKKTKYISDVTYLCKCDCGKLIEVKRKYLKNKAAKSCGCSRKELRGIYKTNNIIGKKFGNLLVLEETKKRKNKNIILKCKCNCGNIVYTTKSELRTKKYCNDCLRKMQIKNGTNIFEKNLINKCVENTNLKKIKKETKLRSDNKTGIKGVTFRDGHYIARIGFKKKNIYLGYFNNIKDAIIAREKAEEKYFNPILKKYKEI